MKTPNLHCQGCGHIGTDECSSEGAQCGYCDSYLPWSELWAKEIVAIERAQRATYTAAGLLAVMAIVAVVLPKVVG